MEVASSKNHIVNLSSSKDLQKDVDQAWSEGHTTIELRGLYKPTVDSHTLLHLDKKYSGITFKGLNSVFDGRWITSHIVVLDDVCATFENICFINGSTTDAKRVGKTYHGPPFRSIYEVIDGAGMLILGNSQTTIRHCTFRENLSGMCGGAISNQSRGRIKVDDCLFEGNSAYHTGAAIDNLTPFASLVVCNSTFRYNLSNAGSALGGPHGQITIFSNTRAVISNNSFTGDTHPIDARDQSNVEMTHNVYQQRPIESIEVSCRTFSLYMLLQHTLHLLYFLNVLLKKGIYPWVRRN